MKLNILLIILTMISTPVFAELKGEICGVTNDTSLAVDRTQLGGKLMTSTGVFKILVVFARFPDDNESLNYWPINGDPVGWDQFIDGTTTENSTNYANLTYYFDIMSIGSLAYC